MRYSRFRTGCIICFGLIVSLFVLPHRPAFAVPCPTSGTDIIISSSCTFPNSTDGVDNGNITITSGATITIGDGQTVVRNSGKSILMTNGSIVLLGTGRLAQTNLWCVDGDSDGYCNALNTFISQDGAPPSGRRLKDMLSLAAADCDDTYANSANNCSWRGAQHVRITNTTGVAQKNYEALLTINTATLISAGQMQADCDDMRFYTQGNTELQYWLESSCNTAFTQVWIRIPNLPVGDSYYTMKYSDPAAVSASLAWTGTVVIPRQAACPGGSSRYATLDGYFPRGNSTAGGTGNGSHTHAVSGSTNVTAGSSYYGGNTLVRYDHTHTFSATTNAVVNTPAYVDTVFCSYTSFPSLGSTDMAAFPTTPGGWSRVTALDNRFMRGAAAWGTASGSDTHAHTYSGTTSVTSAPTGNVGMNTVCTSSLPAGHSHTFSGTATAATVLPPYKTVIYAAPGSTGPLPSGGIVMFTSTTLPPMGWTRYANLDGHFPRGGAAFDDTSLGTATHTHTLSTTIAGATGSCTEWINDNDAFPGHNHTHSIAAQSATTTSSLPPYVDMIFGQKKTDGTTKTWVGSVPAMGAYKKTVTITNSGGAQSDYQALLTFDTATLISQSKLQPDCDDLRVADSLGNPLNYWVESGCNSATTQIWVEIPTLVGSGNTLVDMYYGTPAAANASLPWSGSAIIPRITDCPVSGATRYSALDGLYPRGNSVFGGTGTGAHTHTVSGTTAASTGSSYYGGNTFIRYNHTHTYSTTTNSVTNTPGYMSTIFCQYSALPHMTIYDIALFESAPGGWTRNTQMDNRFMRGAATWTPTGGSDTHSHTFSGTTSSTSSPTGTAGMNTVCTSSMVAGHSHTFTGTAAVNTVLPPYKDYLFESINSTGPLASGGIIMFTSTTLPQLGWTRYAGLDGYFPRSGTSYTGTALGAATHIHAHSVTINGVTGSCGEWINDTPNFSGHNHTHGTASMSFSSDSSLPPYLDVIFGQKKTDGTAKSVGPEQVL